MAVDKSINPNWNPEDPEWEVIQANTSHVIKQLPCPRCKGIHLNMRFDPLVNPPDKMFRHWSWCEETRCPVLMFWDGQTARVK